MKKQFEEHFERTCLIIFLFMFVIIMIPFPFFYSETYIPSFGGVPLFLYGWFIHTAITFALIIKYYRMCMKRKNITPMMRRGCCKQIHKNTTARNN